MKRDGVRALVAALAVAALAGCGGGGGEGKRETATPAPAANAAGRFTNPVHDENFPDPFVLEADGTWYAYGTNGERGNVPTLTSPDLVEWTPGDDAFPELGPWATPGKTWAPEVLARDDGSYVLYYTAQSLDLGVQCLGRAVADAPGGPFVDRSRKPFVCQRNEGGSIDAAPFADDDGRLYLLWKNDGNAVGQDTFIYVQRLSDDGLTLRGKPGRLVRQDAPWEGDLVEAPTLWEEDGSYYLFFSANAYFDERYAVGYATCEGPLGPCEDAPENPILETRCDAVGPGHQTLVREDGATWVVYHAWPPDAVGSTYPGRVLWLDRVEWEDGKPVVHGPTCKAQPRP